MACHAAPRSGIQKTNFLFISLCGTKGYSCQPVWLAQQPKSIAVKTERLDSKPPPAFRVPTKIGIPSPGTFSRGRYELAHSGAQTA